MQDNEGEFVSLCESNGDKNGFSWYASCLSTPSFWVTCAGTFFCLFEIIYLFFYCLFFANIYIIFVLKIHTTAPAIEKKKEEPTFFSANKAQRINTKKIKNKVKKTTKKIEISSTPIVPAVEIKQSYKVKVPAAEIKQSSKVKVPALEVKQSSKVTVAAVAKEVKTDRQTRYAVRQLLKDKNSLVKKAPERKAKRKADDDSEDDSHHHEQQVDINFLLHISL